MKRISAIALAFVITASIVTPAFADGGVVHATDTEPNDDFGTAVTVSEGTFSGEIVNGESDFFKLNASTTEALSAEVTSADNLGDIALRVYDADRTQLVGDGNDFEGIDTTIKLPETGTYYVEVAGQSAGTNSSYTLNIDVVTPAENDQFAPNDDFESAASIPEGFSEARIVGGESDFYRLEANTTDAISVDMTNADALGDLAIRLYDADRTQLVADGNDFEGIDYTLKAPETGTYYIEVLGQSKQTTSNYTLNVDVVTPAENDQFAPNDDFESAAPLREEFNDARVVGGESDYYKITLNESESVGAEIRTADSLGDLVIRLYDPDRTQVASDGNDFQGLAISHQATTAGTYYIEVAGQSTQTTSSYELQSNQTFQANSGGGQVPQDLQRFAGEDNSIGNLDVLTAVNAANNNQEVGGEPVGNLDILKLVNYVNDN